jgi:hypothetical protein
VSAPPPILPLEGDWKTYLDAIYEHYLADLIRRPIYVQGKPVRARFNPATDGKGFAFWHVISEGEKEEDRTPDLRRCERIRWIAWMLLRAANGDEQLLSWNSSRTQRRGTVERLVLFCEENKYTVVLEERDEYFLLVTAYPVSDRRATKLKAEYVTAQK